MSFVPLSPVSSGGFAVALNVIPIAAGRVQARFESLLSATVRVRGGRTGAFASAIGNCRNDQHREVVGVRGRELRGRRRG